MTLLAVVKGRAITRTDLIEWIGSALGILGATLLAMNMDSSCYGWVMLFVTNLLMIAFAYSIGRYGILVQQIGYLLTSGIGIYRVQHWTAIF